MSSNHLAPSEGIEGFCNFIKKRFNPTDKTEKINFDHRIDILKDTFLKENNLQEPRKGWVESLIIPD